MTSEQRSINQAARDAIRSFLAIANPQYALLIDAPWGAGKTHLIRAVVPQAARYVSLNGVASEDEFRRAVLKNSLEASVVQRGTGLAKALGALTKRPGLADLLSDFAEERMLAELPRILVFDDLERCTLDPPVLFGLINEHVEHQKRNVVLAAHADAEGHPAVDEFRKRKEKVIGRTITLAADFDAAFSAFVSALPAGAGKRYVQKNAGLIREVFETSNHQNLRLLRSTLIETTELLARWYRNCHDLVPVGRTSKVRPKPSFSLYALSVCFALRILRSVNGILGTESEICEMSLCTQIYTQKVTRFPGYRRSAMFT